MGWVGFFGTRRGFFFTYATIIHNLVEQKIDAEHTISAIPRYCTRFYSDPSRLRSYMGMGLGKLLKDVKSYVSTSWSVILTTMVAKIKGKNVIYAILHLFKSNLWYLLHEYGGGNKLKPWSKVQIEFTPSHVNGWWCMIKKKVKWNTLEYANIATLAYFSVVHLIYSFDIFYCGPFDFFLDHAPPSIEHEKEKNSIRTLLHGFNLLPPPYSCNKYTN